MTNREKAFLIIGFSQDNIEALVALAALMDISIDVLNTCGLESNALKEKIKAMTKNK